MVAGLLKELELLFTATELKTKADELMKEGNELKNKPMCELTLGEAMKGMKRIEEIDKELAGIYVELKLIEILL
jgi:hypothetical protein